MAAGCLALEHACAPSFGRDPRAFGGNGSLVFVAEIAHDLPPGRIRRATTSLHSIENLPLAAASDEADLPAHCFRASRLSRSAWMH